MFQFQTTKYTTQAIHKCKRRVCTNRQDRDTSMPDCSKSFKKDIDVVEQTDGLFGIEKGMVTECLQLVGGI